MLCVGAAYNLAHAGGSSAPNTMAENVAAGVARFKATGKCSIPNGSAIASLVIQRRACLKEARRAVHQFELAATLAGNRSSKHSFVLTTVESDTLPYVTSAWTSCVRLCDFAKTSFSLSDLSDIVVYCMSTVAAHAWFGALEAPSVSSTLYGLAPLRLCATVHPDTCSTCYIA